MQLQIMQLNLFLNMNNWPISRGLLKHIHFLRDYSEPIFIKHSVMNVRNLFVYYSFNEIIKILNFRTTMSLFEIFELSERNANKICFFSNFVSF